MKLSELKTNEDFDLLCDLISIVGDITSTPKFKKALQTIQKDLMAKKKKPTNADVVQAIIKNRNLLIDNVLRNNKSDVFKILSLLQKRDIKEIEEQPIFKTIAEFMELMKDKELMGFFKSQVQSEAIN